MKKRLDKKIIFLTILLFSLVLFSANVLAASLVAYYKFDDGAATDSSGNGNNGVIYGATPVAGKVNNALKFDGVNDYVNLGAISGFTNKITIEMWIYRNQDSGKWERLISQGSNGRTFIQIRNTDDKIGFRLYNGAQITNYANTAIPLNTWTYVTGVYDGTNLKIYYNGNLNSVLMAMSGNLADTGNWYLGTLNEGSWYYDFNGMIDEVKIYDYARTVGEICSDMGKYWDGTNCLEGCNPGSTQPCGVTDTGPCQKGTQTCKADRTWDSCVGNIDPTNEVCNGIDDDCNGNTDNGFTDENCRNLCENNGYFWTGNGNLLNCCGNNGGEANPFEVTEQSCSDLKDNDCDNNIDINDLDCQGCNPGSTQQCGVTNVGVCEYGTKTCKADRTWDSCIGNIDPTNEVCGNSLDDDCDNSIDEDCPSCNGCFFNSKCIPVGIRLNNGGSDSYCDMDYQWKTVKNDAVSCYNDFECASNNCVDYLCVDLNANVNENKSLIEQILCLLGVSAFC